MRLIEIVVDPEFTETVHRIAEQYQVSDYWTVTTTERGRQTLRMLVARNKLQEVIDALQNGLSASANPRLVILPVEAVRPRPPAPERKEGRAGREAGATREEL